VPRLQDPAMSTQVEWNDKDENRGQRSQAPAQSTEPAYHGDTHPPTPLQQAPPDSSAGRRVRPIRHDRTAHRNPQHTRTGRRERTPHGCVPREQTASGAEEREILVIYGEL
jgi:hypothetical protein